MLGMSDNKHRNYGSNRTCENITRRSQEKDRKAMKKEQRDLQPPNPSPKLFLRLLHLRPTSHHQHLSLQAMA
jgi:hypothetical protein